jgi:diacylglycerol O-acyltransferase
VSERVSPLDASLLYLEGPSTPMHVGSVEVFELPVEGFDHDRLIRLIRQRIAFVPRFRQRIRDVPLKLGRPVWIDDQRFDVTYHVRRSALPGPGTREQLNELVARLMSRPLDRDRPLWEMYLIEGLGSNQFAIVTKTHQAVVDGFSAIDLSQVMLDVAPNARMTTVDAWRPQPEPSSLELLTAAMSDNVVHPGQALDLARRSATVVGSMASEAGERVMGALSSAMFVARQTPASPLNVPIGSARRFATVDFRFADVRALHRAARASVNEVILGVITGALRSWLQARGDRVDERSELRAVVPISTTRSDSPVSAFLVDLPIGEPDPLVRLQRIGFAMAQFRDAISLLGAQAIVGMAGFGPPTLHALGARLAANLSNRVYNLAITNVPGPQQPLFVSGARLLATYPVMPLVKNQALSIGLTSYDGGVFFGLNADRDAVPDLDDLVASLSESLQELQAAVRMSGIA